MEVSQGDHDCQKAYQMDAIGDGADRPDRRGPPERVHKRNTRGPSRMQWLPVTVSSLSSLE